MIDEVISRDGTPVAFRSTGRGPGLVVIPGANRRAHHYDALARLLSGAFPVHVLDRRGRGGSGPQGPGYSVRSEVDDAVAVLDRTGSDLVFGHSYGGLVALHLALHRPLAGLIVYEPAVSIGGSFEHAWLPAFTARLAAGRQVAAMATFLRGVRLTPFGDAPLLVFRALALLLLHGREGRDTRAMLPTLPAELDEVVRLDSDGSRYSGIGCPALLLGGDRSPGYFTGVLPRLAAVLPDARSVLVSGLDHNGPDLNGPDAVADRIRAFATDRAARE